MTGEIPLRQTLSMARGSSSWKFSLLVHHVQEVRILLSGMSSDLFPGGCGDDSLLPLNAECGHRCYFSHDLSTQCQPKPECQALTCLTLYHSNTSYGVPSRKSTSLRIDCERNWNCLSCQDISQSAANKLFIFTRRRGN